MVADMIALGVLLLVLAGLSVVTSHSHGDKED